MEVTREAPAAAPGSLMEEWQAQGQEQGEDAGAKRLPSAKERTGRGFVSKSNRDSPVCVGLCGRGAIMPFDSILL